MFATKKRADDRTGGAGTILVRGLVADGRSDHAADDHRAEIAVLIVVACRSLAIDRHVLCLADTFIGRGLANVACADRIGICNRSEDRLDPRFRAGRKCHGGAEREGGRNQGACRPR